MKDMIEDSSALHNWKQRNGILRDAPSNRTSERAWLRNELEARLAARIDDGNYREIAAAARMNSLDLIETLTEKLGAIGIGGLKAAIQAMQDHGVVTCIQYLHSL